MSYFRSASAQKMVDAAYTKLLIYYHDGNIRTEWGRNGLNGGKRHKDPYLIERLRHFKSVAKKADGIRCAVRYCKSTGRELDKFVNGRWI